MTDNKELIEKVWYDYRTPAYEAGQFRGVPNKSFIDGFNLGYKQAQADLIAEGWVSPDDARDLYTEAYIDGINLA